MWIDSHAHLDSFIADGSWPAVWQRAREAGVDQVVAIGGSIAANELALETACRERGVFAVLGYDRDEAAKPPAERPALGERLAEEVVVGVGETGLDYHYSRDTAALQCALLEEMLAAACGAGLPVVVHTREAQADTLHLLRAYADRWSGASGCPGVIHCYTGDADFARRLLDLGFMISFSGIVTFKKADELRAALAVVPDDRLLIETDAPYLAPVPLRGRRNEPAWVCHVGESVARTLQRPVEEIAALTSANARRLFNLPEAG